MWQVNQTIKDGRFLIEQVLGGGGFGVAYRARDRKSNQQVVIKTLNQYQQNQPGFDELQEKFVNEAMTLKGLSHPHIVKVYELIEEGGLWGMVMEYLDGQELADYVLERGKLTEAEALGYIEQVGKSLIYTHQQQVIHRDIKPHNIMLRKGNREAVLIDFGLARGFIDGKTLTMTNAKTPAYAPIEQYESQGHFGAYTDVYALAATLYHLLTGTPPLPSNYRQLNYPLSPPSSLNPDLSQVVSAGIMRGMELHRQARPQTIEEFLQLLGLGTPAILSIQSPPISKPQPAVASTPSPATNLPKLSKIQFTSVKLNNQGKIIDQPAGSAEIFIENLGKGVELTMVRIPGGKFLMGSPESEKERQENESPQHQVSVAEFYLGQTPVTQAQYQAIMGNNPSQFQGNDKLPVEQLTWLEAMDFCQKLSQKTGRIYRLPSEAEWEYAARAGTTTPFTFGETITPEVVNYDGNYSYGKAAKGEYRGKTTPVGTFPPNLFGLYDVHGNVWEWCLDEWVYNYKGAPTDGSARGDIILRKENKIRLLRGGSWYSYPRNCRSASRIRLSADYRDLSIGFRVVFPQTL
jgi:formylglycine-generating enzyme required for sulfatase activity